MINIFPDHTIEHINHVNDLGFSASSATKTIVPVQGSIPLVTFLAQKPLEQLPFAHCGKKTIPEASLTTSRCSIDTNPSSPSSTSSSADGKESKADDSYYGRTLRFSKWDPLAVALLERHIFVIIAGVHIKEAAKEPTFASITCAPGDNATITLSKVTGAAAANCTLKGTDLDLVSQVELQSPTDSNDKVDGASSVSGDNTQATLQFNTTDLAKLKGTTYTLYYSLKGGSPEATKLTVTVQPVISFSPASLSFSTTDRGPKTITLSNDGTTALTIKSVKVTGTKSGDFGAPTGSCVPVAPATTAAVPSGKTCTVSLTLATTTGSGTASLSVDYDGTGSPQVIQVTESSP